MTNKILNECFNQVFNASKVGNKALQTMVAELLQYSIASFYIQ